MRPLSIFWLLFLATTALSACKGEEACTDWYCEDGDGAGTTDGKGETTDKGGKGKTEYGEYYALGGEQSASTGMGTLFLVGEACRSSAPVLSATPDDSCDGCDFAWVVEVGPLADDPEPCEVEAILEEPLTVGHGDPDELWFFKGEWFAEPEYASAVEGDVWTWETGK